MSVRRSEKLREKNAQLSELWRSQTNNSHSICSFYSKIPLHIFCDTPERAYDCVAYLKFICDNKIHVFFVHKGQSSTIKTIQKLELQAALMH